MRASQHKLRLMRDVCRLYLELGELCERARADERELAKLQMVGRISQFTYGIEMEQSRRQFMRIAALLERLNSHYELVKQLPD